MLQRDRISFHHMWTREMLDYLSKRRSDSVLHIRHVTSRWLACYTSSCVNSISMYIPLVPAVQRLYPPNSHYLTFELPTLLHTSPPPSHTHNARVSTSLGAQLMSDCTIRNYSSLGKRRDRRLGIQSSKHVHPLTTAQQRGTPGLRR